jgi:hypothetical protein
MVVRAEAYEVLGGVVLFVCVDVVEVDDFVEFADGAGFCGFAVGLEVDVVLFAVIVGFVFVEVEDIVVAACAEGFGVEGHFSLASFAGRDFWLPLEFLVAGVTETFGVVLFLLVAVYAFFDCHAKKRRSHIKYFVQTG